MKDETKTNEKSFYPPLYNGETDLKIGTLKEFSDNVILENAGPFMYLGELDGWMMWAPLYTSYGGGSPFLKFKLGKYPETLKILDSHLQKEEIDKIYEALEKKYNISYFDEEESDEAPEE